MMALRRGLQRHSGMMASIQHTGSQCPITSNTSSDTLKPRGVNALESKAAMVYLV
jgi:hypothetical protein